MPARAAAGFAALLALGGTAVYGCCRRRAWATAAGWPVLTLFVYTNLAVPIGMEDFRPRDGYRHYEPDKSIHPAYPLKLSARDLARFGLLYLDGGMWDGERLISQDWIDFVRTPAPATAELGNQYGGQWWLVPDDRKGEVPADAYSTAGNRGQYVIVVPSHGLVIVRRGLDWGRQGFDRWDLLREVLRALPQQPL